MRALHCSYGRFFLYSVSQRCETQRREWHATVSGCRECHVTRTTVDCPVLAAVEGVSLRGGVVFPGLLVGEERRYWSQAVFCAGSGLASAERFRGRASPLLHHTLHF